MDHKLWFLTYRNLNYRLLNLDLRYSGMLNFNHDQSIVMRENLLKNSFFVKIYEQSVLRGGEDQQARALACLGYRFGERKGYRNILKVE